MSGLKSGVDIPSIASASVYLALEGSPFTTPLRVRSAEMRVESAGEHARGHVLRTGPGARELIVGGPRGPARRSRP